MTRAAVAKIARQTAQRVGRETRTNVLELRFAGPLCGVPDEGALAAIRMGAELEAMITDPVYEGKSLAGLIGLARSGEIPPGSRVLYVHLGGAPALDAYRKAFA